MPSHTSLNDLFSETDIVALPSRRFLATDDCGIYFLIKDDEVVYVGQSRSIMARVGSHLKERGRDAFDSFASIPCPKDRLDQIEARYIKKFKPVLNLGLPRITKKRKPKPYKYRREESWLNQFAQYVCDLVKDSKKPYFLGRPYYSQVSEALDHFDLSLFRTIASTTKQTIYLDQMLTKEIGIQLILAYKEMDKCRKKVSDQKMRDKENRDNLIKLDDDILNNHQENIKIKDTIYQYARNAGLSTYEATRLMRKAGTV